MRAMRIVRNLLVIVGLMAVAGQAYAYGAPAETEPVYHGAKYALQEDLWGFPYTLKIRHCDAPTAKHLERVKFDRDNSVVVYRCSP